ncbi:ParB/RepB/Spo0J family partition protein [uncultured Flavobacterium sp.]|uniref:ParB/RepB/Spo0J family partition protein n=1 Tax=uncultured Flavobacterium sp. TaxID=165435 RepID=UPI00259733B9|nr:ParB/RepB/Spo0J family partition protein [uncultured Flavobacterium sp.]
MQETLEKTGLLELQTTEILISQNNPRKTFKEKDLQELAESIKLQGVLQPVLVRIKDGKYELVCGERRLRASIIAENPTIPVFVRELTDEQAFECMIVENLERKDVHPLEEAEAFKRMIDSERYTVPDIAHKLSKSEQLIIQRLKLNSLIDEIKDDFINDVLSIGHAIVIARQNDANQRLIFNNYKDNHQADYNGYGSLKKLNKYIDGFMIDLSKAKFDTERTDLNTLCTSCSLCPKRTGANQLLFADIETVDNCLDRACFEEKDNNNLLELIQQKIDSKKQVYFIDYGYQVPDFIREFFEEKGVAILKENKDYHNYRQNDNQKKQTAYRVDASGRLEKRDIYLKGALAQSDGSDVSTPNTNDVKIANIKNKAIRNLELDQEKITKSISESFKASISKSDINNFELDSQFMESMILYFAFNHVGLWQIDRYMGELEIENEFMNAQTFEELQKALLSFSETEKKNLMVRMLYSKFNGDFPKNIGAKILRKAFTLNPKNNIKEIVEAQQEKADKRIAREKERIEELMPKKTKTKEQVVNIDNNVIVEPSETVFKKVSKKYSLNRSYFKNRRQDSPATISEVAQYLKEHNELPFEYSGDNWVYDAYIEYQKYTNVYHSQYFTPDATALRMAEIAKDYFDKSEIVLDACCGFGQLSKNLATDGYSIEAFDFSSELVETYNSINSPHRTADVKEIEDMNGSYKNIISNPPYEVPTMTLFLDKLNDCLVEDGTAVLLLPKGFMEKKNPKKLYTLLSGFSIIFREDMKEDFEHTQWKSEIIVLRKN